MGNTCATIALQVFELWTEENRNGFHNSQTKMETPNGGCGAKHFVGLQKKLNPKIQNGSLKTAPTLTFERDSQTPNFGNIISLFDFSQKGCCLMGSIMDYGTRLKRPAKKPVLQIADLFTYKLHALKNWCDYPLDPFTVLEWQECRSFNQIVY